MRPRLPQLEARTCGALTFTAALLFALAVLPAQAETGFGAARSEAQSVEPNASLEPEAGDGGSCRVGGERTAPTPHARRAGQAQRSAMERRLLQALSADAEDGDTVVLNTRGYGYHNYDYSRPAMQLEQLLEREAAAQRARRAGPAAP